MTFPPVDPPRFVHAHIADRFAALTPDQFGEFIRYVFTHDGYEVLPVVQSPDLGYHMQAKKDAVTLILLVRFLDRETSVSEEDVQRARRAKELYKTDQAWIIANGAFSKSARSAADELDIEYWDWNELYEGLCQMFFQGKPHTDVIFYPDQVRDAEPPEEPELHLKVKWSPQEGDEKGWYNLHLQISNQSDQHVYIHLELPAFINSKREQFMADKWRVDDFVAGMVYSGASVTTNAQWKVNRLGDRPPKGTVVMTYHVRHDTPQTYHLRAPLRGEACFVVASCYGPESDEYAVLTRFRNDVLYSSMPGRLFVKAYYWAGPALVQLIQNVPFMRRIVKYCVKQLYQVILRR